MAGNVNNFMQEDTAQEHCRDYDRLAASRGVFEGHWEEIARYVLPQMKDRLRPSSYATPGEKKTEWQHDATPQSALNTFSSVLNSLLTPDNAVWHRLQASNRDIRKVRNVALWFEQVNDILWDSRRAATANFAGQNYQNYQSLGAFGTGCIFADEPMDGPGLRYKAINLGELFIRENHQGLVDTAYRRFELTARQAVQMFGEDVLNAQASQVMGKYKSNPDTCCVFLHCVRPRKEYDPSRLDYKAKPWESTYISYEDKKILREGGYRVFPYAISRYVQGAGEVYGRSPAMVALPAIKTLNAEKLTFLTQGHRAAEPVILAADDGLVDGVNLRPGAVNYGAMTAEGRPLVGILPAGNISLTAEMMDEERKIINDVFLVNLFQILAQDRVEMTATEVIERTREKGILLAPTVGRQQTEYLEPLIARELDLLIEQRLLPPMPQELVEAQGDYRIEYDNPMSRAMRAEEGAGLIRTMESTLNIVNITQDPSPLDNFNFDVIVPELSAINGVPARWMNSVESIQAIRQDRAQKMEQAQQVQAAPAAASLISANAKMKKANG